MTLPKSLSIPSLLEKLEQGGYKTMQQILAVEVTVISEELNLTGPEAKQLIEVCEKDRGIIKRTIGELIRIEIENSFSTSSKNIDKLFDPGVPPLKITEICGESGAGKTQLCIQLAVNVQLPKEKGGINAECIYIDTEGSFQISRFVEIARTHGVEPLLKGLHFFRILDHTEFIAFIRQLPDIVKTYPKVKLIIIDSIAYHFRLNVLNASARSAILTFVAQTLNQIAKTNDLAVVATNHVTQDSADSAWIPSLGSSWGYWCANRLYVFRKRHFRYAYLYKHFENAGSRPVQFCIKDEGITDPEEDELEVIKKECDTQAEINNEIDSTWVELKNKQVKEQLDNEEQEKVDDFWDEACLAEEILSQLPPEVHNVKEETNNNSLQDENDMLYPNVEEEEEIPSSQVIHAMLTSQEIPSTQYMISSPLTPSSQLVSSSQHTRHSSSSSVGESSTSHRTSTSRHSKVDIPHNDVSKDSDRDNGDVDDLPLPEIPPPVTSSDKSIKRRKKSNDNDANQQHVQFQPNIPNNTNASSNGKRSGKLSPILDIPDESIHPKKVKLNNMESNQPNMDYQNVISTSFSNEEVSQSICDSSGLDEIGWDSELEEELDYAFLEEINNSL